MQISRLSEQEEGFPWVISFEFRRRLTRSIDKIALVGKAQRVDWKAKEKWVAWQARPRANEMRTEKRREETYSKHNPFLKIGHFKDTVRLCALRSATIRCAPLPSAVIRSRSKGSQMIFQIFRLPRFKPSPNSLRDVGLHCYEKMFSRRTWICYLNKTFFLI